MSFLEELVKKGVIENSQISEIKSLAEKDFQGNIEETLIESGIPEEKILEIKGEYLGVPVKHLNLQEISFDVLRYISEDSATHYNFVPIELKDGVLEVGVTDSENIQTMDALQFISNRIGIPFKVFLISRSDYKSIMESYKGMSLQVEGALKEFDQDKVDAKGVVEESLSK
mgnify:CR=1 FL=1